MVKVPWSGKGRYAEAIYPCLQYAADEADVDPHTAALVMSAFLERLVDEVCRGKAITIPGFGCFGVFMSKSPRYKRRHPHRANGTPLFKFEPATSLRRQILHSAVDCSIASEFLNEYRRNASRERRKRGTESDIERVWDTQQRFRDQIRKQMEEQP